MSRRADDGPRTHPAGHVLPPREQPGYYRGFSTLAQQHAWDEHTREVVLGRVATLDARVRPSTSAKRPHV